MKLEVAAEGAVHGSGDVSASEEVSAEGRTQQFGEGGEKVETRTEAPHVHSRPLLRRADIQISSVSFRYMKADPGWSRA